MALDMFLRDFENSHGAAKTRIKYGIDHFLLPLKAGDKFGFIQVVDRLLLHDRPIVLAAPSLGNHGFRRPVGAADFENALAKTHVRCPLRKLGATRDKERGHVTPSLG